MCYLCDIHFSKASWKERKLFLTRFTAARLFTTTHVVSETSIDIHIGYVWPIFIMLNGSPALSLICGITQRPVSLARRDGFHRENDVTATDTSFTQAPIKCYQSIAEIHVILLKSQWCWNIYALLIAFQISYDKNMMFTEILGHPLFFTRKEDSFSSSHHAYGVSRNCRQKLALFQGFKARSVVNLWIYWSFKLL